MLQEFLEFRGSWRRYQQRVLDRLEPYRTDRKIHIVAAPGAGKTVLGIELLRRLDRPALILAPTITIREQWVQRIRDNFLRRPEDEEAYISQDLRDPKRITVATYQALHSAMIRCAGTLEEPEDGEADQEAAEEEREPAEEGREPAEEGREPAEEEREPAGDPDFDVVEALRAQDLGTLCLDECHHLRSEWWKALEQFRKQFPEIAAVALTATPPYDSTPAQWERYLSMCGEVDEEITVPELVKEGTLCPHQDYVYFNYPTREEEEKLRAFRKRAQEAVEQNLADETLRKAVQAHPFLNGKASEEAMLENPSYLSALLIYLEACGLPWPAALRELLGFQRLPEMSEKWMGILLQGFLYEDAASYPVDPAYREEKIRSLKAAGLLEKRRVSLEVNEALERSMIHSLGKCASIREIVFHEYGHMGGRLRLLILADYIRREYEPALGRPERPVENLGVVPLFEQLRREAESRGCPLRLGILCGSLAVIPAEAGYALRAMAEEPEKLRLAPAGNLSDYVEVEAAGDRHVLTGLVTRLFEAGYLQVLVGTKSLLGEGWDSPCVNALILASFVGSYMLSNQMRGRAIRVFAGDPDKTSNIWHLVCVRPAGLVREEDSEDFRNLARRMEHFLGLHYEKDLIENGLERLSAIQTPFTRAHLDETNRRMRELSCRREELRDRWQRSLALYSQVETVRGTGVKTPFLSPVLLVDVLRSMLLRAAAVLLAAGISGWLLAGGEARHSFSSTVSLVYTVLLALLELPCARKLFTVGTPLGRLSLYGEGIRQALAESGQLDAGESVVETESSGPYHLVYLKGGTGRDKALFARCVLEFFGEMENQRYILYRKSRRRRLDGYFAVPDCFARRREDADRFAASMSRALGRYRAVYTRNAEGRRILLEGRKKAMANRQQRCLSRQRVKGALE